MHVPNIIKKNRKKQEETRLSVVIQADYTVK